MHQYHVVVCIPIACPRTRTHIIAKYVAEIVNSSLAHAALRPRHFFHYITFTSAETDEARLVPCSALFITAGALEVDTNNTDAKIWAVQLGKFVLLCDISHEIKLALLGDVLLV